MMKFVLALQRNFFKGKIVFGKHLESLICISYNKKNCFTNGPVENFQVFQKNLILQDSIDQVCLSADRKEKEKNPV